MRLLTALSAIGLALAAGVAPAQAANPGRNGAIAFVRHGDLYAAGGTGRVRRLTHDRVPDSGPAWSPDGTKLAWNCGGSLCLMRADGTGRVRLGRKLFADGSPSWSPDGRRLAFSRDGIFTIGVDGRGLTRLTWEIAGYDDRDPSWSPNGGTIAFARFHRRYPEPWSGVVLLDLGSLRERPFASAPREAAAQFEYDPDWSPDGRSIALTGEHASCCPTPVIVHARSQKRDVGFGGWENESWNPTWSPDGRRLAFVKGRGIYIAPAGGGRALRASWSRPEDGYPAWQPMPVRRLSAMRGAEPIGRYLVRTRGVRVYFENRGAAYGFSSGELVQQLATSPLVQAEVNAQLDRMEGFGINEIAFELRSVGDVQDN